jgi:hypothetical protein
MPTYLRSALEPRAAKTENTLSASLTAIATYIPTEIIGLYIAAIAVIGLAWAC